MAADNRGYAILKVQTTGRFLRVPDDLRGKAVLIEMDAENLTALRSLTHEHEKELYRIDFSYHNTRSLSQNARFHAIITRYAEKIGLDMDEAKAQIKHEFGVTIPYRPGFIPPTRQGCFVEIYGQIEFQVSTAVYDKGEMIRLMEGLDRVASEAGIT